MQMIKRNSDYIELIRDFMSTLVSLNVENNSDVNVYNQIIILKFLSFFRKIWNLKN